MDVMLLLKALILGAVEGLTEFLPVSSTGHLILTGALLKFNDERGKLFLIVIQGAAILAVVWEFRQLLLERLRGLSEVPYKKFICVKRWAGKPREAAGELLQYRSARFFINLFIAFLPLAILGLLFGKPIKAYLFNAVTVATTFILGGIIILWAERRKHTIQFESVDELGPLDALKLGLAQALALVPGTSRSGATIIGGLFFGLSRKAATEFSFFLAIPTLIIATIYQLYKERALLHADDLGMWVVGFVASFVSAFFCVRWLIRYISSHDFSIFAWYRIAFGIVVLLTWHFDWVKWTA